MREFQPDLVVHLAALVGAAPCERVPAEAIRANVTATAHVARACREHGARLAFASTVSVSSRQSSLYALTKRWGEEVAALYAPDGLLILRLAHPYGPGVEPGRGRGALPTLLWQAEQREPMTVYGEDVRSWCWVEDAASAIRVGLEAGVAGSIDIGRSDEPVSMAELALRACELTGAPHELIEEVEVPAGYVSANADDTAIRELGWEPRVELATGMSRVLEWLRSASPAPVS
jgi:nucleoside-diphosphate-sugar epimerase